MKNLTFILLALAIVIIMIGCGKSSDDNNPTVTNKDDIIPLAVGNTWNYELKNDSGESRMDLLITEKKSMPVFFQDSSKIISDIFITRIIVTSKDGTSKDTIYNGFIKEKDGIALVANCDSNTAIYIRKYLNYFKIGWVDTLTYDRLICSGSKTIKTTAGEFACIRYTGEPGNCIDGYYCKGVGLVSEIAGPERNSICSLVSYKLK